MGFEVITHPEALAELDEAIGYLQERSLWSAEKLLAEYDTSVEKARQHPTGCHFIYREYRSLNLKRFAYHVIYRVRGETLFVIAFAHDKRHPDYWKTRIQDDEPRG